MPALSKHYAVVTLPNGTELKPISVTLTADESWSPYIQGTIVLPSNQVTGVIDPRAGNRIKIRMQQDFGDILYMYELTAAYSGSVAEVTAAYTPNIQPVEITRDFTYPWNIFEAGLPLSTVTAAYAPVTPLKLTNAKLSTVWRMSEFLHGQGTFNPYPSTIFAGDLGVRSIAYDYVSKETTIEVASDEALRQDVMEYPSDLIFVFTNLREMLQVGLGIPLQPGTANKTYSPAYELDSDPNNTIWDKANALVQAAGLVLYNDEQRRWYLVEPTATAGEITLDDEDNITQFTKTITRDGSYYNSAVIQYRSGTAPAIAVYDQYFAPGTGPRKSYFSNLEHVEYPGPGAAQAIVQRSLTRGELYEIEAIANFDARPRQTLTVDITGEPVKTGIIQAVTWALPAATMNIDIRDLEEV